MFVILRVWPHFWQWLYSFCLLGLQYTTIKLKIELINRCRSSSWFRGWAFNFHPYPFVDSSKLSLFIYTPCLHLIGVANNFPFVWKQKSRVWQASAREYTEKFIFLLFLCLGLYFRKEVAVRLPNWYYRWGNSWICNNALVILRLKAFTRFWAKYFLW